MAHLHTIGCKRVHDFCSRSTVIASVLATIVTVACAIIGTPDVVAQPTNGSNQVCPNGYALISTHPAYCFSSSGDVVEPAANEHSASLAGCRQGYGRMGALCISPTTGDVELAETPDATRASR